MSLLITFTAGVVVGITLSEVDFTIRMRRACAAVDELQAAQP
jgi:hypothetical protein